MRVSLAALFFPWQVSSMSDAQSFYESFLKQAAADYPKTVATFDLREKLSQNLISPYVTELSTSLRDQAQDIVKSYFALRQAPSWTKRLKNLDPKLQDPGNTSILMSYDFHVDANQQLRLIEVNTNASLSLIVDMSHRVHGIKNTFSENFREELLDCFAQEHHEAMGETAKLSNIGIVDEKPETQRLFAEFKLFQELFGKRNWNANFFDPSELKFESGKVWGQIEGEQRALDLIYNRDTDFYLTKEESVCLRKAMEQKTACITPHPFEYRLLADKERLLELSKEETLSELVAKNELTEAQAESIRRSLIRTVDIHSMAPDHLWSERKKYFFKPRNSHGGKAVYRGSSMSKTTFQQILSKEYLVQEMVPPALLKFKNEDEDFKSDLRFYVYRDRIQLACARLYRGMMTNAQTPGGGVSVINWT